MLATLIGSSAQAEEGNAPAAAAPAVACKKLLRLTFICPTPRCCRHLSSDQVLFQDRCANCIFRIPHVAEPNAPRLTEQHVGIDLVEAVVCAHPAHQLAIGNA